MTSIRTASIRTLGAVAVVGMGVLCACSSGKPDKPAETPAPVQTSPAMAPTEKAAVPGVDSSFAPSVKQRSAPSALPGNIITGG